MKIVIAPDSFKGTMSSQEVCDTIKDAIDYVDSQIETVAVPVSDGGEGLVDAMVGSVGGRKISKTVKGPNFKEIEAFYGIAPDNETAFIEMASASGMTVAENGSTPWDTTTYGTGQLIIDAIDRGCRRIILGIGGSATNDAGIGMAAAFGVDFTDSEGREIPLTGGGLEKLKAIDFSHIDERLKNVEITVACDVDNPLYGEKGAAHVFGPQKGADVEMVGRLDENIRKFAGLLYKSTGKYIDEIPGTGAAGGIAACLLAFTNADLRRGIDIVLDYVQFDKLITDADFIITGEGKIDSQSLSGKVVLGIARRAKKNNKPVIVIAGSVDADNEAFYENGVTAIFGTVKLPETFDSMKPKCRKYLYDTAANIIKLILACK